MLVVGWKRVGGARIRGGSGPEDPSAAIHRARSARAEEPPKEVTTAFGPAFASGASASERSAAKGG
ncbi:MAG: hypothetical protein ABEJ27_04245 [Halodesulfurarchaeum sp.]